MSTKLSTRNLATRPHALLQLRRLRVAFAAVITKAPTPSHAWADVSRKDPRAPLPFGKEREMLHAAIRQGCTTPARVIEWRLAQLRDDLEQFGEGPSLDKLVYVQLITEQSEAIHAQTIAHAFPTPANRDAAVRETEEASAITRVFCALMRSGQSLLHAPA